MIVTDRFVFLHLHKSGGSFANEAILRHVPGARQVGYHLPAKLIPDDARRWPVLGLVRNPWSYYVSWFAFQQRRPQPNALFRVLSEEGRLDFNGTINRMLDLGLDDALLARVVALLPREYGNSGLNLPGHALAPIRGTSLGFYSFLYDYLYAGVAAGPHVGRMEELPQALLGLFGAAGCAVSEALRARLEEAPPLNRSVHGPYGAYYDQALRERVESQDAAVIRRHGYAFAP